MKPRYLWTNKRIWMLGLVLFSSISLAKQTPADLVLLNGNIVTLDASRPQVSALAARGPTIVLVGTDDQARKLIGKRSLVIDLKQRLALPGFIEAHAHFLALGRAIEQLDLSQANDFAQIVSQVAQSIAKVQPGFWLQGRGWHQEKWSSADKQSQKLPSHHALSRVSAHNPVFLKHASGHMCLVNQFAMTLAGIDKDTPDPPGGQIVRDGKGLPTGVLRENAMNLVQRVIATQAGSYSSQLAKKQLRHVAQAAMRECLANGVTSFHDAGVSYETVDFYRQLEKEKALQLRLWVMLDEANENLDQRLKTYRRVAKGDQRLTVRAIKRFVDGALGAHGAWLLKPYSDMPDSVGLNVTSIHSLRKTAQIANEYGYQLCTHAIGDRANREILDIYEQTLTQTEAKHKQIKRDVRWRVEHAQHLSPADMDRFSLLGVIASMQGVHLTSDGPWVTKRLGQQRVNSGAYAWQSLLTEGAILCNGSDAPVEDINPILGFYALIARRLPDGTVLVPHQRLRRQQALRAMTLDAAYAGFEESRLGSLEAGKLADIVVLSQDILSVPEERIKDTKVLTTIVGGRVAYQSS